MNTPCFLLSRRTMIVFLFLQRSPIFRPEMTGLRSRSCVRFRKAIQDGPAGPQLHFAAKPVGLYPVMLSITHSVELAVRATRGACRWFTAVHLLPLIVSSCVLLLRTQSDIMAMWRYVCVIFVGLIALSWPGLFRVCFQRLYVCVCVCFTWTAAVRHAVSRFC